MSPQHIRLEALKLAVEIDGRHHGVLPTTQVVELAARFADFIVTGKAAANEGDQS